MKVSLSNFKNVATGRWAISISTFSLTVPFGMATTFEREMNFQPELSFSAHTNVVFAGYFAGFLYAFVMQATFLKHRRERSEPLWKCISLWFSIGAIQGIVSTIYSWLMYDSLVLHPQLILVPALYTGTALALLAFYFGTIENRRMQESALSELDVLLQVDHNEMQKRAISQRVEIEDLLRDVLKPQIQKLHTTLSQRSASDSDQFRNLRALCGEVLLSIGSQLNPVSVNSRLKEKKESAKQSQSSIFLEFFPKTISVRLSILVMAIGSASGQYPRNGWTGVLAGLLGVVVIGVILKLLSEVIRHVKPHHRGTFTLISYPLVFLTQVGWNLLNEPLGFELNNPYNPAYSGIKTLYGVYVASVISNLIELSASSLNRIREVSGSAVEELSALENADAVREQNILDVKFGTLQGKISGMILTLNLFHSSQAEVVDSLEESKIIENLSELLKDVKNEIQYLGTSNAS